MAKEYVLWERFHGGSQPGAWRRKPSWVSSRVPSWVSSRVNLEAEGVARRSPVVALETEENTPHPLCFGWREIIEGRGSRDEKVSSHKNIYILASVTKPVVGGTSHKTTNLSILVASKN